MIVGYALMNPLAQTASRVQDFVNVLDTCRARLDGGSRFGEFCYYYSCLPLLPGFACSIPATWGPPSWVLYMILTHLTSSILLQTGLSKTEYKSG